ncbi:MAG: DUF3084 domain-containing protein [Cyanobacteriota bacterium]|nr:DUF3084 domain-containing protein [Cyanobacteriota bacterium]
MSGWLLILALLVLGGVLSTLGDRLGSKVGKARLSLFNLRPRKTAVVITALTGSLISAMSLGLMLLVSERLRVGLFELDQLQDRLRNSREALSARQADLRRSNGALERNREELRINQKELARSRIERNRALQGRQAAIASERKVTQALSRAHQRVNELRRELQPLQNQRLRLEAERDRLTRDVRGRDAEIQRTEKELAGVRARIQAGARELKELESKVIALRRGDVLIASGQPLSMARIRLGRQADGRQSIDALLQEANAAAFRLLLPGQKVNRQILLVPRSDIERLDLALRKQGTWVVIIRSAANILRGEQRVLAFPDLRPNLRVVRRGEVLARTVLDGDVRSPEEVRSRLNLLLAAALTQAQRQGTVVDGLQVDGAALNQLGLSLSQRSEALRATLEAVALADADTPDPIAVELRWKP